MKILYITSRVPYPINKGDKLRAYYQLQYLSRKHEVFLIALDTERVKSSHLEELKRICSKFRVYKISKWRILLNLFLNSFNKLPFQVAFFHHKKINREIDAVINEFKPDIIFTQLIRTAEYVRRVNNIPRVIDFVDALSKGLERRFKKSIFILKWLLQIEYERVKKYESDLLNSFDTAMIISEEDKRALNNLNNKEIHIIPNGINLNYFHPIESEKIYDIFFFGNLNYPPNVLAANFLVKKILPLLKRDLPDVKILIAGSNPKKTLYLLKNRNTEIRGWIDDPREYYKISKVFVAPMFTGTGLQNKVLQAMAMKIPCVVSELVAKGLGNDAEKSVLISNSVDEFVNSIKRILFDSDFRNLLVENAFSYVQEKYNWENIVNDLEKLFEKTINSRN